MKQKQNIAILGSTGSIGTQTLSVIDEKIEEWNVTLLTAHNNVNLLIEQAKKYLPRSIIIANPAKEHFLKEALQGLPIMIASGQTAILSAIETLEIDIVVAAMVGYSGLPSTLKAIECEKTIALANKETLVVAGDLIKQKLEQHPKARLLPVDSEHSAIFQCLQGEDTENIEKIWLTASGGPFRGKKENFLKYVTPAQALKHPNWEMGAKITIDSATLMNKGFEAIEAKWLFHLKPEQIGIIVHPESIVHSFVQFTDGSLKAQCGLPDMRLPIQYALYYPKRLENKWKRFDFTQYPSLHFETPDSKNFPNLALAYEAMKRGGNMPCILNAANEIAIQAFLGNRIPFLAMSSYIEKAMQNQPFILHPSYEDYICTNQETRKFVCSLIG